MKIKSTDGSRIEIRIQGWSWVYVRVACAWEDAQALVRTEVSEDTVRTRINSALCMGGEVRITRG